MPDSDIEELLETMVMTQQKWHPPITSQSTASSYGSLVDREANGGLAGADIHVLQRMSRKVSVIGIDDYELPGLDIVACVALIQPTIVKLTCSCMNMHIMVEVILCTLLVRLSGSTVHVMTNLIMLEVNKSSHF